MGRPLAAPLIALGLVGIRLWTWAVWAAGFCLTGATLVASVTGIVIFTGILMLLFCPWAAIMGRIHR